jgi:chloramphenicol-sensitive protein RarD
MSQPDHRDSVNGFLFAGGAYLIWGVLPVFFKWMGHIPTLEIVAQRILWSIPVVACAVWWQGRGTALRTALSSPRTIAMAGALALLLSFNWGVYIWAVNADRALETALGYFINPLFSMCLAALLLGERMSRLQMVAFALAAMAVAVLTFEARGLPLVALALCISWGLYAYFKRTLPVGPIEGFFIEIMVLVLPALALLLWLGQRGNGALAVALGASWTDLALFAASGLVTAVPLLLYAVGAKGLRLSTIAIMQYLSPSLLFLMAVFVFKEPISTTKLVAFVLIWAALALYTIAFIRQPPRAAEPAAERRS